MMPLIHAEDITDSDCSRLWIRFLDSPSPPSLSIDSITHSSLLAHNLNINLDDTMQPRQKSLVNFDGIILGATTVWRQVYRRTYACSSCEVMIDSLEGAPYPYPYDNCCRSPCLNEDLSRRILIPCQDLLIGDLSSSTQSSSWGDVRAEGILVSLVDDLVTPPGSRPGFGDQARIQSKGYKVGDCVSVIGFARASIHQSSQSAGSGWGQGKLVKSAAHVTAMSILHSSPHLSSSWLEAHNPLGLSNPIQVKHCNRGMGHEGLSYLEREEEEAIDLDTLAQALFASIVGCDSSQVPMEVLLALLLSSVNSAASTAIASSLFTSAAAPDHQGNKSKKGPQASSAKASRPIHVLFLGEADCPMLLDRVLRPAALALSPQSIFLSGPHVDEPFTPRITPYQPLPSPQVVECGQRGMTGASSITDEAGGGAMMVRSSLLTNSNRGIFIADGRSLGSAPKQKLEILEAMMRGFFSVNSSDPGGGAGAVGSGVKGHGSKAGSSSIKVPMTSSIWATAPSSAPNQGSVKGSGSRLGGSEPDGFDLVI